MSGKRESAVSARRVEAAEKQAKALELRKAGETFQQIANTIGYEGPGAAYKAVHAGIRKMLREPAEALIELEVSRLDEMLRAIWPKVLAGDTQAIDRVLRIMDRRAKYLGLDAPTKVDITGLIREEAQRAGLSAEDAEAAVLEAVRIARGAE